MNAIQDHRAYPRVYKHRIYTAVSPSLTDSQPIAQSIISAGQSPFWVKNEVS